MRDGCKRQYVACKPVSPQETILQLLLFIFYCNIISASSPYAFQTDLLGIGTLVGAFLYPLCVFSSTRQLIPLSLSCGNMVAHLFSRSSSVRLLISQPTMYIPSLLLLLLLYAMFYSNTIYTGAVFFLPSLAHQYFLS